MGFRRWLESGLPHVNSVGGEMSGRFGLVRGKAWNQTGQDCYEIASAVAERFGYEPAPAYEISSIMDGFKRHWASRNVSWAPKVPEPSVGQPGLANFVVRVGDDLRHHVSFEYRGKEYNYGAATPDGFRVLFRIPLRRV